MKKTKTLDKIISFLIIEGGDFDKGMPKFLLKSSIGFPIVFIIRIVASCIFGFSIIGSLYIGLPYLISLVFNKYLPFFNYDFVGTKVLHIFFTYFVVLGTYNISYFIFKANLLSEDVKGFRLWVFIASCIIVVFIASYSVGDSLAVSDFLYSNEKKVKENTLIIFLILVIPALIGFFKLKKEIENE